MEGEDYIHMKPVLAKAIEHAFVLAVADCFTRQRRSEVRHDIYSITEEEWAQIDPMAIAQNLCCRLLGKGGWEVRGVYSPNATVLQVMGACFGAEISKDPLADIKEALGLEDDAEAKPDAGD